MIKITTDDGKVTATLDRTASELCYEALNIVQTLYNTLNRTNPLLGSYFEARVRLDDDVWTEDKPVKFEHTRMVVPNKGNEK